MKKTVKALRNPTDPLGTLYWECPGRGCDTFHHEFLSSIRNKQIKCSFCGSSYKVLHEINETISNIKLVIEMEK